MSDATAAESKPAKKGFLTGLLGGGKSYWVVALIVALIAVTGVLSILGKAAATTTYYVLGQDVPQRTQITEELLVPVQTNMGGEPRNALDIVDIRAMNLPGETGAFALVPLQAGDVPSRSNVGPLERITADLPDNFVAASFSLAAENAVAGKVRAGDYIDITAIDDRNPDEVIAKTVLHHVLVLDVTAAPQQIADAANSGQAGDNLDPGPEAAAVRGGIPSLYVVGLSPQDATTLALVRDNDLMIALSSNTTTGSLDAQSGMGQVFAPAPVTASHTATGATAAPAGETATEPEGDAATEPEDDAAADPEN